jgi:hypothetical protein
VAIVQLTPAADRPYVGGSTNDSILQLTLGYNGLGRLDGQRDRVGGVCAPPPVAAAGARSAGPAA